MPQGNLQKVVGATVKFKIISNLTLGTAVVAQFLISTLALADSVHTTENETLVSSYSIESSLNVLHVQGQFRNACQTDPKVIIKSIVQKSAMTVAELAVSATVVDQTSIGCGQVLWGSFDILVDLRTLDLPLNQPIKVFFAGHPEEIVQINEHREGGQLPPISRNGRVVRLAAFNRQISEHRFALQVRNSLSGNVENLPLRTMVDLESYVGQSVNVLGFKTESHAETEANAFGIDRDDNQAAGNGLRGGNIQLAKANVNYNQLFDNQDSAADSNALAVISISTQLQ